MADRKPDRYRFPLSSIQYALWLYHRFSLNQRDAQELLQERGIHAHPVFGGMTAAFPNKDAFVTETREHGVPVTNAAAQRVGTELARIWDAWYPGAAQ